MRSAQLGREFTIENLLGKTGKNTSNQSNQVGLEPRKHLFSSKATEGIPTYLRLESTFKLMYVF